MTSVAQLEAEIFTGWGVFLEKLRNPVLKKIYDRALVRVSTPYKLAMRILFFLSSVAQLEAEIFTELDILTPVFFFNFGLTLCSPYGTQTKFRHIAGFF